MLATWQSAAESGSSSSLITVEPAGTPDVAWSTAISTWGGTRTLTVSVAAGTYAAGRFAIISGFDDGLPSGALLDPRQGWAVSVFGGARVLINAAVPVGDSIIGFTWPPGGGAATVTATFLAPDGGVPVPASIQLL